MVGYGTRISGLIRDCLVSMNAWPYQDVETWATNFVDNRLKQADTLVTDEGQMYTRNGKMGTVANISWTIYHAARQYIEHPDVNPWVLSFDLIGLIDLVSERLPQENDWLELLDGTTYYRCYPQPDGGLLVPSKSEFEKEGV